MTITGGTALSKDEIDRMVKEAESFAAEDHKRREAAEARNQSDQLSYQVGKFVEESKDKISESDITELESKNDELKKVLEDAGADTEALKGATESLTQVYMRVGQAMHENAQQAGEQAAATGGEAAGQAETHDDDVEGESVDEGGA